MQRVRLGHFLAISLALHAAAMFMARSDRPVNSWSAGPVVVRLIPVPENIRNNRPNRVEAAAPAMSTQQPAARQTAVAAERVPPQRQPARIPAAPPTARMTERPGNDAGSGQARATQPAETAGVSAELEQLLLDSLRAALVPHFSYPLLARRRGWEGIVRVGMRIEANGRLSHLHLVEPSPYSVLNTAALDSLSRLARLPNAGLWLQGRQVDLVIPVEYRLLEG